MLGIAAYSGSGKTTLMRKLIPCLIARGKRLAVVKHAHHDFDIDYPGKDSYELRKAGANQVLVGSGKRWAMIVETPSDNEANLADFLHKLDLSAVDLILVEGFREVQFPKLEVHRSKLGRSLFYPHDESVIALATDAVDEHRGAIRALDLNQLEALADFIVDYCSAALSNPSD